MFASARHGSAAVLKRRTNRLESWLVTRLRLIANGFQERKAAELEENVPRENVVQSVTLIA